jgi:hypothetical protein
LIHLDTRFLILIGVMIGSHAVYAGPSPDQPSASTPSPSPTAAAGPPTVLAPPSADVLKRARLAGYRIRKLRAGTTVFCKQEAHVGTRFSTDSCIDETTLEEFLLRAQSQRDSVKNHIGTSTDYK